MKLQNLKNLPFFIIDLMFLTVVVLLPGSLQDIPQWAWAIFLIVFMGYCLVSLAREGFVEKFLKRGAIAMLLFIPFIALITLLPGGDLTGISRGGGSWDSYWLHLQFLP